MAKWNLSTVNNDDPEYTKQLETKVGISMFHCLKTEDQKRLRDDWNANGGFQTCPFWKYCFDNINVSY